MAKAKTAAKVPAGKPAVQKAAEVAIEHALLAADFKPIEQLIPYARNAKKHPDEQVARIAGLIEEFGWTNPVLADEKGIVAGHGRVMAARRIYAAGQTIKLPNGIEIPQGTVPVVDVSGWSEEKRRFYIIADNQSAVSPWDDELLGLELNEISGFDFDMDLLGFDEDELKRLMGVTVHFSAEEADEEVEPPKDPVTRLGDVWLLGKHRIICGDSTKAETVERVLAGAKPHLLVSDPPYGVEYDAAWRNKALRADGTPSDGRAVGKVENDDRADWREAWGLSPAEVAYVWHGGLRAAEVAESLRANGFEIRAEIIWNKSNFAIGRGDYHWKHEPCLYAVKASGKSHWQGARDQSTVWDIAKPAKNETGHSTQKPIECMKRPIENNSAPGDGVYEPFSGSGTTLIAAEMTGRVCFAIELSPAYVDVAVCRFEKLTNSAAILEGDGRTFAEVMAERLPPGAVTVEVAEQPKKGRSKKPATGGRGGPSA